MVFDHYENRFVVLTLEKVHAGTNPNPGNSSRILLAVSKTATPATATTADWYYAAIDGEENINGIDSWSDYPGFEVDEEATAELIAALKPVAPPAGTGKKKKKKKASQNQDVWLNNN